MADRRRLRDWKEIAAFFGRDERTVRRWERQRGLPVHRVSGGARNLVFAYADELDAWLHGGQPREAAGESMPQQTAATALSDEPSAEPLKELAGKRWPMLAFAASLAGIVLVAAAIAAYVRPVPPAWTAHKPEQRVQDLYLDATYALATRQSEGILRATQLLTEATTLDPNYADAYVKLADAYNLVSQYTLMPAPDAYPRALAAANRALSLEPSNAGAHAALAFTTFYWAKDFAGSKKLFEQSIELDPDVAQTRHWFALTLMVTGETDIPLREITRAQELNPESRAILANKGLILFYAGRPAEALSILESLSESEPKLRSPHEYLATIYLDQGRFSDFLREYATAARVSNNAARLAIAEAARHGLDDPAGTGMLVAMLDEQIRQFKLNRESAFKVAATAAMLGRNQEAMRYLEESFRRGENDMLGIRIDPAFKKLRGNEVYRSLVARMGFSPIEQSDS